MKTKTGHPHIAAALRRRVRQFYNRLNRGEFEKCYGMIDPFLRKSPTSITELQYTASLKRFRDWSGQVRICQVRLVRLHVNEPNRQYDDRDFAQVEVLWEDRQGQEQTFKERWVRDSRGWWFTRGTGFVVGVETPSGNR